jgi:hypothetical protein
MAPFPSPLLLSFFSHFTHEKYIQTTVNCSSRFISHAKTYFGAVGSQKDHFDGLSFAIISSVESCFTNDHTIITTPAVWEPQKFQGIIEYANCTKHTQKYLM